MLGVPVVVVATAAPAAASTLAPKAQRTTYNGGGAVGTDYGNDGIRCAGAYNSTVTIGLDVKCRMSWSWNATAIPQWSPGVAGYALCEIAALFPTTSTAAPGEYGRLTTAGVVGSAACSTANGISSSAAVFQYVGGPQKTISTVSGSATRTCYSQFVGSGSERGSIEYKCSGSTTTPTQNDTRARMDSLALVGYFDTSGVAQTTGMPSGLPANMQFTSHNWFEPPSGTAKDSLDEAAGFNNVTYTADASPSAAWPPVYDTSSSLVDGATCDAHTFYDAQGGAWVTLSALVTANAPAGSSVQKVWTGTWDATDGVVGQPNFADSDNTVTLALPAPNSRPVWGWVATFEYAVKLPSGQRGAPISAPAGEWSNDANGDPWHTETEFIKGFAAETGVAGWVGASTAVPATISAGTVASALGVFALSYYGTTKLLNAGASAAGWSDTSAQVAHLGAAAKGFSPSGTRYYSGDTAVGSGSTWTSYEHVCSVIVRPDAPPTSQPGSVVSGGGGSTSAGTTSSCTSGIKIPVVGWIVSSFKELACAMGNMFDGLLGLLRDLFIPKNFDYHDLTDPISTAFPFNIVTDLGTALGTLTSGLTGSLDGGDACPVVPVGGIAQAGMAGLAHHPTVSGVSLRLPTPSSAGCTNMAAGTSATSLASSVGDVFGFRTAIRDAELILLYAGFAMLVIRGIVNRDPDAMQNGGVGS